MYCAFLILLPACGGGGGSGNQLPTVSPSTPTQTKPSPLPSTSPTGAIAAIHVTAVNQPFLKGDDVSGLQLAGNWPQHITITAVDQQGVIVTNLAGVQISSDDPRLIISAGNSPNDYVIQAPHYFQSSASVTASVGTVHTSVAVARLEAIWYDCCNIAGGPQSGHIVATVPAWSATVLTLQGLSAPYSMTFDAQGELLIADTNEGLYRLPPGNTTFQRIASAGQFPWGIATDLQQRIWVESPQALSVLDGQTFNVLQTFSGLGGYDRIAVDSAGNVWRSDASLLQEATNSSNYAQFSTITLDTSSGPGSLHFDAKGVLWDIGALNPDSPNMSAGSVAYLQPPSTLQTVLQNLNFSTDMAFDHGGNAWIVTRDSLLMYRLSTSGATDPLQTLPVVINGAPVGVAVAP